MLQKGFLQRIHKQNPMFAYPIWNTEKRGWNTDLIRSIRVIGVAKN